MTPQPLAETTKAQETAEDSVHAKYPNLSAISNGTISGRFSEWPLVKPEAIAVLRELAAMTKRNEAMKRRKPKLTPAQECAFTARSRMDIPGTSKNDTAKKARCTYPFCGCVGSVGNCPEQPDSRKK